METKEEVTKSEADSKAVGKAAFAFILLMSIMSLFNDMTFEGANEVRLSVPLNLI